MRNINLNQLLRGLFYGLMISAAIASIYVGVEMYLDRGNQEQILSNQQTVVKNQVKLGNRLDTLSAVSSDRHTETMSGLSKVSHRQKTMLDTMEARFAELGMDSLRYDSLVQTILATKTAGGTVNYDDAAVKATLTQILQELQQVKATVDTLKGSNPKVSVVPATTNDSTGAVATMPTINVHVHFDGQGQPAAATQTPPPAATNTGNGFANRYPGATGQQQAAVVGPPAGYVKVNNCTRISGYTWVFTSSGQEGLDQTNGAWPQLKSLVESGNEVWVKFGGRTVSYSPKPYYTAVQVWCKPACCPNQAPQTMTLGN